MSLSKGASADLKREQCLIFLREMKQAGMLEDLMNVVRNESSGYMSAGSMTDAAKRRCPDETALQDFEFLQDPVLSAEEACSASLPVVPKSLASPIRKPATAHEIELPEGISTYEEWGRTICDLPKVKDMCMTYRELMANANSGDQEMAKYLSWVKAFNGSSARTNDFKRFLLADDAISATPRVYFPGTAEIRPVK